MQVLYKKIALLFYRRKHEMSKSEDTKQLILDTAKIEFMDKGYSDASVRNIAKQAGLTTGAIFRYFADKESLFAALVSPVAEHMLGLYRKGGKRGFDALTDGHPENMWNISEEVISVLVEYIFANKDAFYLLINQSAGSAYENFVDQLIEEEEKQTYGFQQEMIRLGYPCRALTPDEIHILLSAQYYAVFEIVRHKLKKEEALDRVRLIAEFFGSAWKLYFA